MRRVSLNITNKCNLGCFHCFNKNNNLCNNELNKYDLFNLIDQMKEINCDYLAIGGGEPLMRDDLLEILSYAKKQSINPSIVTNCLLVTKDIAKLFNQLKLRKIKVSIDGVGKVYEQIRDGSSFDELVKKIKILRKHFTGHIQASITLSTANLNDYKNIIELADNLNLDSVRIAPIMPLGRALKNTDLLLSQDQFINFIKDVRRIKTNIDLDLPDKNRLYDKNKSFGCHCGKETCWVLNNGDFYSCIFFGEDYKIGNIKNERLASLISKSKKSVSFSGNETCKNCSSYEKCRAGCRARALYKYNDINAVDPFCLLKKNETNISNINNTL